MKIKLLLLLVILIPAFVNAQTEFEDFGKVSREELELKKYEKDTTAAAVILFHNAYLEVDQFSTKGWTRKRHIRIKILKQAAVQALGNRTFYSGNIEVKEIEGASYNLENGKVVKSNLSEGEIFKTKQNKNINKTIFALPNVKEGSVIEYLITEKSHRLYFPFWVFQDTLPVVRSEFSFFFASSELVPNIRGPFEIIQTENENEGKYQKWVLKDIPAFKTEPLMPDKAAYMAGIVFSYKKRTWHNVYSHFALSESFGDILKKHRFLKKKARSITHGIKEPTEKVKAISNYVKNNISWNGVKDCYADHPFEVLKRGKGTSGDINLIYAALLKRAGFKVNMVLVSTRDNGYVLEDSPYPGQFNYVICELTIDDKRYLLDATEKHLPYNKLPARVFNHKGFFVSDGEYGWVPTEPEQYDKISVEAGLELTGTGELKGDVKLVMEDYAAFKFRQKYIHGGEEHRVGETLNMLLGNYLSVNKNYPEDPEEPVSEQYNFSAAKYATVTDEYIYFNPYVFLREEQNVFRLEKRLYPVDFEMPEERVVVTKIKIPDGYSVEELPQSEAFVLPGNTVKFFCSISQSGNEINVITRSQINKTLFQPFEYPELKGILDKIAEKKSASVVLKKKSSSPE